MDSTQQLIQENRDDISALRKIMAPSWVSSPSTRGTWDIFLSCFITLFACAYSVLHLNIPMNSNTWAVFRSKVKWVVFATLFPDVIVVMAFYQFTRARVLKKRLDELRVDNPNLPKYDLRFCFYVVMGGFRLSIKDIKPGPAFNDGIDIPDSLPLTPMGFLLLAKNDAEELRGIRESHCKERSKASTIQKTLVFLQISWMFVQCGFRKAQNLPIALLEYHTMAHVFFALLVSLLWLKKPMDVSHAEILKARETKTEAVWALIVHADFCKQVTGPHELVCYAPRSRKDIGFFNEASCPPKKPSTEIHSTEQPSSQQPSPSECHHFPFTAENDENDPIQYVTIQIPDKSAESHDSAQPLLPLYHHDLPRPSRWVQPNSHGDIRLCAGDALPCGLGLSSHEMSESSSEALTSELKLTQEDVARLERLAALVYRHETCDQPGARRFVEVAPLAVGSRHFLSDGGNALFQASERRRHSPLTKLYWLVSGVSPSAAWKKVNGKKKEARIVFFSSCLAMLYMLPHYYALNSVKFPSELERRLWQVAAWASYAGAFGALGTKHMIGENRGSALCRPFLILLSLGALLSRLYLTVGSFLILRRLPIGAFVMPEGPNFMPHA